MILKADRLTGFTLYSSVPSLACQWRPPCESEHATASRLRSRKPLLRASQDSSSAMSRPSASSFSSSLSRKSARELQALVTDPKSYAALLHSLDSVKQAESLVHDLKQSNLEQARKNLAREGEAAELRNQCAVIRTSELAAAQERLDEMRKRVKNARGSRSPALLVSLLEQAASEVDEESEKMHREFIRGELDVSEFLPQYRAYRLLYHQRELARRGVVIPRGSSRRRSFES